MPVAIAKRTKARSRDCPRLRRKRIIENAANMPKAIDTLPCTTMIRIVVTVPSRTSVCT